MTISPANIKFPIFASPEYVEKDKIKAEKEKATVRKSYFCARFTLLTDEFTNHQFLLSIFFKISYLV
jgi:hypothetical protein